MAKVSKRWAGTGVCSSPEGFGFEALHLMQSRIVLYRRHLRMGYRDRRTISRGVADIFPTMDGVFNCSPNEYSVVVSSQREYQHVFFTSRTQTSRTKETAPEVFPFPLPLGELRIWSRLISPQFLPLLGLLASLVV
ncbi:hypothetical protein TNCV_3676041 [Trichonephila clavipes]|nr:hypothetical protein TNCV_3676041 [Trichonephila clavipes]